MKSRSLLFHGFIIAAVAVTAAASANEPAAASLLLTSKNPVMAQAPALMNSGKFKEAETLLAANMSQGDCEALRARSETMDIIRRRR